MERESLAGCPDLRTPPEQVTMDQLAEALGLDKDSLDELADVGKASEEDVALGRSLQSLAGASGLVSVKASEDEDDDNRSCMAATVAYEDHDGDKQDGQ